MQTQKEILKVIIVDDEEKGRYTLKRLIEEYVEDVDIVAITSDVLEAIKAIQKKQPDIVFLDIEMPGYSGFKLIEYFDKIDFEIVFTTAYEQYAAKAYKIAARGYLLKPIDIDELIEVFHKIRQIISNKHLKKSSDVQLLNEADRRVIFPTQSGLIYLKMDEICYLGSSGRYTNIYLITGEQMLTTISLKECCEKLSYSTFIRVHRSYIINLSYIQNYTKGRGSFIVMDNEERVDVGLFYKEDLDRAIDSFLK